MFQRIGVDPYGISAMAPKTYSVNILLSTVPCKVANILKQEMLSVGADAAVARGSVACSLESTDVLLMGTQKQLLAFAAKIARQPFGLAGIAQEVSKLLENLSLKKYALKTACREILLGDSTKIMGILNVTPDSFSDGNAFFDRSAAIERAMQMVEEGADIIDVGGESSRPGSQPVSVKEELDRVIPIVEALVAKIQAPISVDTTKAKVADAALAAGAEMLNDISALSDPEMASVAKKHGAALVLMHMRGTPETMQKGNLVYSDLMAEIYEFLRQKCQKAVEADLENNQLVCDPGIGFGKSYEDNCRILSRLGELKGLGVPLMVGSSRKAFIGQVTGGNPQERLEGTAATVTAAILNGCHIVRVHDVAYMKKVAAMTDAILGAGGAQ